MLSESLFLLSFTLSELLCLGSDGACLVHCHLVARESLLLQFQNFDFHSLPNHHVFRYRIFGAAIVSTSASLVRRQTLPGG